ncbi:cytochrome c oxidase subunit 3 [Geminicoccaceae bacterium 1502E]|nr:cytochrome c oxidase subunit 3 [Geminicoccaceae bacterium 1502E]
MAGSAEAVHAHGHEVKHDYHLVDPSPWPFVGAMSALVATVGGVLWMHEAAGGGLILILGILCIIGTMFGWWRDVLRESRAGSHKAVVARGLRLGMALFITTEVLFFFAFFWAFFWGALYPPDTMAVSWPPEGIKPVDAWDIPLLNTLILLLSGATVTWAHHAIRENDQRTAFKALLLTVGLGVIFTGFQVYEYLHAIGEGLKISSGNFGSSFYMLTGFHGFHVFVGTVFLFVCMIRAYRAAFHADKHVGFEAAAWYWHFVDVVWLFLFVCVYVWGGALSWTSTPAG